ncbi:pimeloyl-ACP methyl ester carboxylesterase [Lewinella aquimaris]|uniref:Pimeloyl-ACP methyl ester carboxylesterase n=1 Tax=Neolewinella aquimaris TaxID=1835722 RepID=A0A840EBK6_9BACT|nr:T9SS type A sorting domain-containing protein [Neolewinella aquimaris]MBB4078366.1 pimeloyl-ACP methyl ester carboxylesterase [Neolewinella aquimaris]
MKHLTTLLLILFACTCVPAQTYVSVEEQETVTAAQLGLILPIATEYDVVNYKVRYTTLDAFNQPDTASGLLSIPKDRTLRFPMAVYMHGTVTNRDAVPSRQGTGERTLVSALTTSGYIVVAPDYIGLGDSDGFHPYVHAASESSAGRDLILAAQQWMEEQEIAFNDQLFVTGYSQGGHAVQALHRDIQADPGPDSLVVTAGAHLSGPYSISGVMREATLSEDLPTLPGYIIYTYLSYNNVYGIYDSLGQAFVQPYLDVIKQYNAEEIDGSSFNAALTDLLEERDERLIDMFRDSIGQQIADDDDDSRIVQALRENDTYEWAPSAPTLLYYCTADEQVPFRNAIVADSVMRALGSTTVIIQSGGERTHVGCVPFALLTTLNFFDQYATRDVISSVGRPVQLNSFGVSPNPAGIGTPLRLTGLSADGTYPYELYDATGRTVQRGSLGLSRSLTVDGGARTGVHLLRVTLPDGNFVVRRVMLR